MQGDYGIAGWLKNSFIDFPGTVSTVLFFSGCNLRCPYCQNPRIVRGEDTIIPWQTIKEHLKKRAGITEGVVISGGEPTIHACLPEFIEEVRSLGLKVKLDTNGLFPEAVERCSLDYLAMDLKTVPSRYVKLGSPFDDTEDRLRRSLSIVKKLGERAEVRITVAPGLVDKEVIASLGEMCDGVSRIYLQQFQNETELMDLAYMNLDPVPIETIRAYRDSIAQHAEQCVIRGYD